MKFRSAIVIGAIITLSSCTQTAGNESKVAADPVVNDTLSNNTPAPIPGAAKKRLIIAVVPSGNYGQKFQPFENLYAEGNAAQSLRDSLYYRRNEGPFTSGDSALFMPGIEKAYRAILRYTEQIEKGVTVERVRAVNNQHKLTMYDESHLYLRGSGSTLLNDLDFMLLAGGPFMYEDPELYRDPNGNPEARYTVDVSYNCQYFFNYVYSRHPGPIDITYGPPLSAQYGKDIEIKGIGSLSHNLANRIPVWFLTAEGIVPATLLKVRMKLRNQYNCISPFPEYTFACPKNVDRRSILGVFYSDKPIVSENSRGYKEPGSVYVEYDLDNDMQPEFIRVESVDAGASSDELSVVVWYAMINGEWVVVDLARLPDCT